MTLTTPSERLGSADLGRNALHFASRVFQRINAYSQETELLRALASEFSHFLPGTELWWIGGDCETLRTLSGDGAIDESNRTAQLDGRTSTAVECALLAPNATSNPLDPGKDGAERFLFAWEIAGSE
jgi:hypothetical protein